MFLLNVKNYKKLKTQKSYITNLDLLKKDNMRLPLNKQ